MFEMHYICCRRGKEGYRKFTSLKCLLMLVVKGGSKVKFSEVKSVRM
jgi:hypothetical protein